MGYRAGVVAPVSEADVVENLLAIDDFDLPVDVVQVDDGWQADVGDWLGLSGRFSSLPDLVRRIRDHGRRPGIWLAPFVATAGPRGARPNRRARRVGPGDDAPPALDRPPPKPFPPRL
jgi:alpha-galactosidase